MMAVPVGVKLERNHALIDVLNEVNLYGEELIVRVRDDNEVTRDLYGSIKSRDIGHQVAIKTYPVTFNPNMHQLEKAGLKETVDVMAYTAMKAWTDAGLSFEDIDMVRSSVILRGIKYWVKDKTYSSHFADTYLYILLGLRRA